MQDLVVLRVRNPLTGITGRVGFAHDLTQWQAELIMEQIEQDGWEITGFETHQMEGVQHGNKMLRV